MSPTPKVVLLVGTNPRNLELLGEFLEKQGYYSLRALSTHQLDQIIDSHTDIALSLLDITGFDPTIWEYCHKIQEKGIHLLVISPREDRTIRKEGLSHGAQMVLTKPLGIQELSILIHRLLEE